MADLRYLVVNADDFGLSSGVNRGIIEAHERGIVTSASLMVRASAAVEAATYGREQPGFSLGLHVDLGEWSYGRDGEWRQAYGVIADDNPTAVREEVSRQLEQFRALVGVAPSHLDSHQHVHLCDPAKSVLLGIARELDVPLRHFTHGFEYCGAFYGQTGKGDPMPEAITVEALIDTLASLTAHLTELACHPGLGGDLDNTYGIEREIEVTTLCDPRVRGAITAAGVRLISFAGVHRLGLTVQACQGD